MQAVLYLLIALFSTTIGALTGMGGGVILKPVLDAFGHFSAANIGVLSSITVLCMSVVSVAKQLRAKTPIKARTALPMAAGSVVGGVLGQALFGAVQAAVGNDRRILMVQNIALALLIVGIFFYMLKKDQLPTLHRSGVVAGGMVGVILGVLSSFLGIGGGPINIAIMVFVFSWDTKTATVHSILTILFAQVAKLCSIALGSGFGGYDFSMLAPMVVGAVAGGYLGAVLNKRLKNQAIEKAFNAVQVLVFCICVYNIVRLVAAG